MLMALELLKKVNPTLLSNLYVGNSMQKNFVCESLSNLCFINQCEVCKSIQLFSKLTEQLESSEESVSWKEWQKPEKKFYVNIEKVTKKGTVSDLVNHISKMRGVHDTFRN